MKLSKAPNVGVVIAIGLLIAFLTRSTWERFIFADSIQGPLRKSDTKSVASYTPADYDKAASKCLSLAQFDCAETNWEHYLTLRPNDGQAWAKLGIARNRHDDHEAALVAFERAISLGEGTYDLFAYYADSLAASGRTEDAVNWYYKALVVVPSLVDVRGKLAKLLVLQKKYYEALSLLESFDAELRVKGSPAYFEGQRIAIDALQVAQERYRDAHGGRQNCRHPRRASRFADGRTIRA